MGPGAAVAGKTTRNLRNPREDRMKNGLSRLERAKGFEPSTPTLARLCSTPELHPHPRRVRRQTGQKTRAAALLCQRATGLATVARPAYETVNARLAGRPFRLPGYAGYRPQDRHPCGGLYPP